jgi:hypothetical protein
MAPETRRYVSTAVVTTRVVFGTTLLIIGVALLQEWNNGRTAGVIAWAGGIWNLVAALRTGIWIDSQGITARDPCVPGGSTGPTSHRSAWTDPRVGRQSASAYTSER